MAITNPLQPPMLLGLPLELREMVYDYVFTTTTVTIPVGRRIHYRTLLPPLQPDYHQIRNQVAERHDLYYERAVGAFWSIPRSLPARSNSRFLVESAKEFCVRYELPMRRRICTEHHHFAIDLPGDQKYVRAFMKTHWWNISHEKTLYGQARATRTIGHLARLSWESTTEEIHRNETFQS